MLIGTLGLIGSGKGTVAEYLVKQYGYRQDSFASTLKDIAAILFNWDREMLEGATAESRAAREVVDQWWSTALGIPNFTPRLALQLIGTETFRNHFHVDTWVLSAMSRYKTGQNVVISDVRFPNEVRAIKQAGGILIRVDRGAKPSWWDDAILASTGDADATARMRNLHQVHESEWAWSSTYPDVLLLNDGSLADLYKQVDRAMSVDIAFAELPIA